MESFFKAVFVVFAIGCIVAWNEGYFSPGKSIQLTDPAWHVEPHNSRMILDWVTFKNDSDFGRKDFVVECDAHGNSGTTIEKMQGTLYEVLQAKQKKTFYNLSLSGRYPDQISTTTCNVVGATFNGSRISLRLFLRA